MERIFVNSNEHVRLVAEQILDEAFATGCPDAESRRAVLLELCLRLGVRLYRYEKDVSIEEAQAKYALLKQKVYSVTAFIQNTEGYVLTVSRKGNYDDLGLPGGKIDPGETAVAAIRREVLEETGLNIVNPQPIFQHYDETGGLRCITFRATEFTGTLATTEDAWIGWLPAKHLISVNCSFRQYNQALFDFLGVAL